MVLYVLIGGALFGIAMLVIQGSIKLFLPRRMHANVDRFFEGVMRWLGRLAVLGVIAFIGFLIWLVKFSGY